MSNSERAFVFCLVLAAVLPILSWVLSALGVPCKSILDDEGLRWLFRHASDCLHSRLVMLALCCTMMQGVIQKSRLLPLNKTLREPRFYRFAAVYAVVLILIFVAALSPESPLLSITGGLAGSPLVDGLFFLGWFTFMVFCLCYGHSKREPWIQMLTYGIRRHPLALPFAVAVSFCWQCIQYMIP
ncbi:MAG: hypothetical protein J5733_02910 [Bacteroidaceae bacterium]|nr:hypothetical protein [Bacteroidaceae bacterium]